MVFFVFAFVFIALHLKTIKRVWFGARDTANVCLREKADAPFFPLFEVL